MRRIETNPAITLHTRDELVGLEGNGHLDAVTWRDKRTGTARGARDPPRLRDDGRDAGHTGWLGRTASRLDSKGFIKTGPDLTPEDPRGRGWPLARAAVPAGDEPPGVFAVGDVRAGSVKRASAAGEARSPSRSSISRFSR